MSRCILYLRNKLQYLRFYQCSKRMGQLYKEHSSSSIQYVKYYRKAGNSFIVILESRKFLLKGTVK